MNQKILNEHCTLDVVQVLSKLSDGLFFATQFCLDKKSENLAFGRRNCNLVGKCPTVTSGCEVKTLARNLRYPDLRKTPVISHSPLTDIGHCYHYKKIQIHLLGPFPFYRSNFRLVECNSNNR